MSSQIFKLQVPNEILFQLLDDIAVKTQKYYIIDYNSFKKGNFNNSIKDFIDKCVPYYHLSKQKYLNTQITYNSFITIIRQICNYNKITYTSKIKYDKSKYSIFYYIYLINI
jgi:hypothetical protein